MDIRCASRAHDSVNVLDGATLVTAYNESSTTPAPVVSVPASGGPLAVTSSAETTPPSRDAARRHPASDRRSPGLNGATSSAKCHRRADGYVFVIYCNTDSENFTGILRFILKFTRMFANFKMRPNFKSKICCDELEHEKAINNNNNNTRTMFMVLSS